jgi:pimeloyl-ACP methyl ester carboxylesterase
MMHKVFLIAGLGADRRLFNKLDLPGYEKVYIDWIEPDPKDTITTYAQNLIEHYHITPQSMVVGVSLGGIITVEISTLIQLKKAVIISSIKSAEEFPWYFSMFRRFPVYKIIPHSLMTSAGFLIKPLFGKMSRAEGLMFVNMLKNSSPTFIQWAMHAILHWQPNPLNTCIYHIVGNRDLIFAHKRIKSADYVIDKGSHDMVYNRGGEISQIVQSILQE